MVKPVKLVALCTAKEILVFKLDWLLFINAAIFIDNGLLIATGVVMGRRALACITN